MFTQSLNRFLPAICIALAVQIASLTSAQAQDTYLVQPGDELAVSVWKEPDLTGDIVVHPDGTFAMPLIGMIRASGRTTSEVQAEIKENLQKYIPEPIVTIGLKQSVGRRIYVIGQVNAPGSFTVTQPTDVMQALSLAQGMTPYAAGNKIRILRRTGDTQEAIGFRYSDVEKGEKLGQNIVLKNGDVVVVP